MDNYFPNISPKISGSQEDNQISIFDCPHSFFGRRGHANIATLLEKFAKAWAWSCLVLFEQGFHILPKA